MKRIFSLFLSACLAFSLLSGCSNPAGSGSEKPTGETPMGRYIEEQGGILEGVVQVYDFQNTADGGFTFFGRIPLDDYSGKATYKKYTVPAGSGPITSEDVPNLAEFATLGVRDISEGSDGTVYILYSIESSYQPQVAKSVNGGPFESIEVADLKTASSGGTSVDKVDIGEAVTGSEGADSDDGSISMSGSVSMSGSGGVSFGSGTGDDTETKDEAEVPETEGAESGSFFFGGSEMPNKFASGIHTMDDGGFLVFYGDKGVSRYDAAGALLGEYTGNAYDAYSTVSGNTMILGSVDGASLLGYDLSTGKQDATYSYDNVRMGMRISLDAENLYLVDSTGIYRQTKGSTLWEKLVDGDLTSLVMPNLSISGFAPDGSGGFATLLATQDSVQLMRYTYSADTPTNPDTELSIFSLNDNSTIRQAIGEFQRRNPNVRVNFRVGLDNTGSATAEDVIRALNTELLAGKGPDLILLDGLNLDSYIDKGVLLDLTDFVKAQGDLLPNLTNAYEKDGKLYGVPSRFTFPVMMGGAADVDSMGSLQTLVERVVRDQGGDIPFLRKSDDLWAEDGVGMMMDYYDSVAGSFLKEDGTLDKTALTAFFTAMQTLDKTMKEHSPQSDGQTAFITMSISASGATGYEPISMGPVDLKEGRASFHTQEMAGVFALNFISDNLGSMEGQKLSPLFNGSAYTPKGGVGINAAGKQQELAKSFLEMLLSATVQDSYLYDGYPVNRGSLDKLVKDTLDGKSDMGFLAMCDSLTAPLRSDAVIKDAVRSQMKGLMDSSTTPEQAATNVVEKTQLYLAE